MARARLRHVERPEDSVMCCGVALKRFLNSYAVVTAGSRRNQR